MPGHHCRLLGLALPQSHGAPWMVLSCSACHRLQLLPRFLCFHDLLQLLHLLLLLLEAP
jgi:hypothetical protein